MPSRDEVLDYLREISTRTELLGVTIGLFGSYARNRYNSNSDIDVVFKTYHNSSIDEFNIMWYIEDSIKNKFGIPCDIANYEILEDKHRELVEYAEKYGDESVGEDSVFNTMQRDVIWVG